jgi:hypothetical protein
MGYLNQQVVTVDAILTKKGREALARGTFLPTQFSLADDEIDYTMYNPNHPSGSAFYGEAIEGMPLLEAFPDETQIMKYKLLTLPRGTARLPVLDLGFNSITLKQGSSLAITPQTLNYLGADTSEPGGYSATISDVRILSSFEGVGVQSAQPISLDTVGTSVSRTVVGTTINIKATTLNTLFTTKTQLQSTITVVGRDSGARITIPITITKAS